MPVGVIKGPKSEVVWSKAVDAAKEQYPGLKSKDSNRFYAIVMTIYKKMCKNQACTPKDEGRMGEVLGRIELLSESYKLELPKKYTGWQIYEPQNADDKKLVEGAIKELNGSMRKASSDLMKWMRKNPGMDFQNRDHVREVGVVLRSVWKKHVEPVLSNSKYADIGFSDPEPWGVAGQKLIDLIKSFYKVSGWTSLGDYL